MRIANAHRCCRAPVAKRRSTLSIDISAILYWVFFGLWLVLCWRNNRRRKRKFLVNISAVKMSDNEQKGIQLMAEAEKKLNQRGFLGSLFGWDPFLRFALFPNLFLLSTANFVEDLIGLKMRLNATSGLAICSRCRRIGLRQDRPSAKLQIYMRRQAVVMTQPPTMLTHQIVTRRSVRFDYFFTCKRRKCAFPQNDLEEAVACLLKAIEIYTDMGRFTMAAKHHQSIAEMYEADPNGLVSAYYSTSPGRVIIAFFTGTRGAALRASRGLLQRRGIT